MSSSVDRRTVKIASHGETLDTWIYPARGSSVTPGQKSPVVILGHGLGGIKKYRLDAFADKFSEAGYMAVVFDYRYYGDSSGTPRGLIDINSQQEDWDAVLAYVEQMEEVDAERIGIFGSSFGGGHVIMVAAKHGRKIKATVSQCPFTDGFASASRIGLRVLPFVTFLALKDLLWSSRSNPTRVPLTGPPGSAALMNNADCIQGHQQILPKGWTDDDVEIQAVPARIALAIPFARPGAYASQVKTPIFFAICGNDTVAPPGPTLKYAKQAPRGIAKWYDGMGHFDIYVGEAFERASKDYVEFYKANL